MKAYTITPKGQVTIPVSLREELKLKPGDRIIYEITSEGILIKPAKRNMLGDFGFMKNLETQKASMKEIQKAIRNKMAKKRS